MTPKELATETASARGLTPTPRTIAWGWLLVGFVLGLFTALYGPDLLSFIGRPSEPLNIEKNNLRQISLALANYQQSHGTFPPAFIVDEEGKPMHSWRVLILRELERKDLHALYNFDLPWDHPKNLEVAAQIPSVFTSPYSGEHPEEGLTTYLAVSDYGEMLGAIQPNPGPKIGDRPEHRILLIEAFNKPVRWTEPVDISPEEIMASLAQMEENGKRRFHVVLADGSIRVVDQDRLREGRFYVEDGH